MPTFTTEEEQDLTLPKGSVHRARLDELTVRTYTFTDRDTNQEKEGQTLDWWFKISQSNLGPEYIGRTVKASCPPKLTSREGNKFREWAEALLGREIPVGMQLDTDDLVGMEAEVVIGHRPDRKDPKRMWDFVEDVIPVFGGTDDAPPF